MRSAQGLRDQTRVAGPRRHWPGRLLSPEPAPLRLAGVRRRRRQPGLLSARGIPQPGSTPAPHRTAPCRATPGHAAGCYGEEDGKAAAA